jgi:hypothetical protein
MERVEPAGRGERKMGLRWRLICEGRLVWFVLRGEQGLLRYFLSKYCFFLSMLFFNIKLI